MPYIPKHRGVEINASSMADIAFLLLSFFLMTTVIETDKGLSITLPEWRDQPIDVPKHERNVFAIHINSSDAVMIEGEISSLTGLRARVREFVLNHGVNEELSDSPQEAIVSLKADCGTSHKMFIDALDEVQGAYYEMYAERAGMSTEQYRKLDYDNPDHRKIIDAAKKDLPMNISLAEPAHQNAEAK